MSVTKKKIDESVFIIAKDNITDNVQAVVTPSNFQVGLKNAPADLTLTGKFSTSEKDYVANSSNNWSLSLEDHVTVSSISTTYSSSSGPSLGYVIINLPKNPRVGQLVIIKEFSGTASVIPLRIYDASSKMIDGANYKTISSDYGALQFFWQGANWISISSSGTGGGTQGYQGYQGYQGPGFNTISSASNNRILTSDGTVNSAVAEANLTFDGTTLTATGGSTLITDATLGNAAVGSWPYYEGVDSTAFAMFGHKDLNQGAAGNYSLIQGSDGTTYVNSPTDKKISFTSNATELAYLYYSSFFSSAEISFEGIPSFNNTVVIGNPWGGSKTSLYAGTGGIILSGSGASTIITGSALGNADAYIGSAEIGVHPFWGRNYAMFGHKDLNNASDGNAALIQSNVGDTFLGAVDNNYLYFKNGIRTLGYFQYSTFFAKSIFSLSGADGTPTSVTIGNSESSSNLTLNAGSGSIDVGTSPQSRSTNIATGAAVQTVTLGSSNSSSTLTLDAGSGGINIGTNPGGSSKTINIGTTAGINTDSNIGSEYLASKTVIKAGGPFGSLGGLYLSGSTVTTYTIGGETGTGTISLGRSTTSNTINIGNGTTTTGNIQTVNIASSASGTGLATITIGNTNGASSLALRAGTGDITMSGIVKNSSQPGFLTSLSATQSNFATSSDVTVLFDSEIFDNASNFDTGTYTFTAPETGKYLFNVAVRIDNVDTAADYYTLYLITSNRNYRLAIIDPGQFAADLVYWYLNGSAIADMDASDTAYIVIRQQAGTAQTDIISATTNSFFSGWMLG